MSVWCITTSPDNFAKTAELGFTVQGIKSRHERSAKQIRPGDKVVYYLTKVVAFGGVCEVISAYFEHHDAVWSSKPGEDYPWRFEIRPEVVITDPGDWVPADDLRADLEFPRKWPEAHWKLAFQGNIREWPDHDYHVVRSALERVAAQSGG